MVAVSIAPGLCVTLWDDPALDTVLTDDAVALLEEARPEIVCVHGGPDKLAKGAAAVVQRVRARVPGVRIWVGVGCDAWLSKVAGRSATLGGAVDKLVGAAQRAAQLGAEAVVWDPEAPFKRHPRLGAELATTVITQTRAALASMPQGHTAYDHPTLHSKYPWRAWCGPGTVDFALPQVYVAPQQPNDGTRVVAAPGALARRAARSARSWSVAVDKGWIARGLPVHPYVQAHHVGYAQTASFAARQAVVAFWSVPRRLDKDGRRAIAACCALRRLGYLGADAVTRFQTDTGLKVDGVVGRATLAALGVG